MSVELNNAVGLFHGNKNKVEAYFHSELKGYFFTIENNKLMVFARRPITLTEDIRIAISIIFQSNHRIPDTDIRVETTLSNLGMVYYSGYLMLYPTQDGFIDVGQLIATISLKNMRAELIENLSYKQTIATSEVSSIEPIVL